MLISWDPDGGKMNRYNQYTPGDMWDYAPPAPASWSTRSRWPAALARHLRRAQRLPLCLRARQPTAAAGAALHGADLDAGHRREDRQAGRLRSRPRHRGLGRHAEPDARGADQEAVPVPRGRQQLLVGVLQPEGEAPVCSVAADLRRGHADARQLRNSTGSMLGGGIRLFARTQSEIVVADPFTGAVMGRICVSELQLRAGDGGRPRVHRPRRRHRGRL